MEGILAAGPIIGQDILANFFIDEEVHGVQLIARAY
jgi:hypothetical protein